MVAAVEPLLRARLLLALIALVVLALGMLTLIVLGGRYARRIARTPLPPSRTHDDRWYAKPLVPREPDDEQEPESPRPENDGPDNDDSEPGSSGEPDGPDAR